MGGVCGPPEPGRAGASRIRQQQAPWGTRSLSASSSRSFLSAREQIPTDGDRAGSGNVAAATIDDFQAAFHGMAVLILRALVARHLHKGVC